MLDRSRNGQEEERVQPTVSGLIPSSSAASSSRHSRVECSAVGRASSAIGEEPTTGTLIVAHGEASDCNLYKLRNRLYLSPTPVALDDRFLTMPYPKIRCQAGRVVDSAPRIHAMSVRPVYEMNYCNIQLVIDFEHRDAVEQAKINISRTYST